MTFVLRTVMSDSVIICFWNLLCLMTSDMQPAPCNSLLSCCLKGTSMVVEKRKTSVYWGIES